MAKKTVKKPKKKKLQLVSKIRNRILRLWSVKVRERDGGKCIHCGFVAGTLNDKGNAVKCDAHHLLTKFSKNNPLKFDIRNGVTLCPSCHKFSNVFSAHHCPILFAEWIRLNRSDQYQFVLTFHAEKVDLDNRVVLEAIESRLKNDIVFDLEELKAIDLANPRKKKEPKVKVIKETLDDLFDEYDEYSSSSSS